MASLVAGVQVTTVAFVTYKSGGVSRRVGPLELEAAGSLAKELGRRETVSEVLLEVWALLTVKSFGKPA